MCVRTVVCTSTNRSSPIARRSSSSATLSPQATSQQQRPGLPHRKDVSGFQRAAAQGDGEHTSVYASLPSPHPGTLEGPQLGWVSLGASCCQMSPATFSEPPQLQESRRSKGTRCLWYPLPKAATLQLPVLARRTLWAGLGGLGQQQGPPGSRHYGF